MATWGKKNEQKILQRQRRSWTLFWKFTEMRNACASDSLFVAHILQFVTLSGGCWRFCISVIVLFFSPRPHPLTCLCFCCAHVCVCVCVCARARSRVHEWVWILKAELCLLRIGGCCIQRAGVATIGLDTPTCCSPRGTRKIVIGQYLIGLKLLLRDGMSCKWGCKINAICEL